MYDYAIIGSGIFGSVFANLATKLGKKVFVVEKRPHIGGNCYTEERDGIHLHMYGPHIFHTNNTNVWKFWNQYAEFNNFVNRPKVNYKDEKIFSFPINLLTLHQLWGVRTAAEAKRKLESVKLNIKNPANMEEWCLAEIGEELYETFIKGYTMKQWKRSPRDLPASIIKRIPIRIESYDDNYYFDKYQGIPIGGYTQVFQKLLDGIEVITDCDFFKEKETIEKLAHKVVYSGRIDELMNFKHGMLEYRTLEFQHTQHNVPNFQGTAVINYTHHMHPWTRSTEHTHFEMREGPQGKTWVTYEIPADWTGNEVPYYSINNEKNNAIANKYKEDVTKDYPNYVIGGRLGSYQYYDMDQVTASAIHTIKKELNYSWSPELK